VKDASRDTAVAELLAWFRELRIEIPVPEPVILRWGEHGFAEIAMADYDEDEDLWIDPDQPTLEDLAHGAVRTVERHAEVFPGKHHWRRWKFTGRVWSWLRTSGIANGYGIHGGGLDPYPGGVYRGLTFTGKRSYILFRSRDWWEHLRRNGLRHRFTPEGGGDFGWCEKCYPEIPESS
jgi:hypothetical protein